MRPMLAMFVCMFLALIAWGVFYIVKVDTSPAVAQSHFWDELFQPGQRTIVVPGDTGFSTWQIAMQKHIGLAEYVAGTYRNQALSDSAKGQVDPSGLVRGRYTSIIDLDIVKQLTEISDARKIRLTVTSARDLQVGDLKEANIVLVGAPVANPWVELFEPKMDFIFSDASSRQYTVINRSPLKQEPPKWTANYDDPQHRVYGVIAFLPNLGGTGNVLIVEGTSMAGTQAAWDFLMDDSAFVPFIHQICKQGSPIPHFQLVLDSTNLTGYAVKKSVLAWRTMQ